MDDVDDEKGEEEEEEEEETEGRGHTEGIFISKSSIKIMGHFVKAFV